MRIAALFVLSLTTATAAQAQSPATYVVRGMIADHDGHAIADAEVALVEREAPTRVVRSDTDGHFEMSGLAAVSPAILRLRIRRLGFAPRDVSVTFRDGEHRTAIEVTLDAAPAQLEGVSVTDLGGEGGSRLHDFYARKATNSFGRYIEGASIEKRRPLYVSEMLRAIPGVIVTASSRIGNTVKMRGCGPLLWVDGVRIPGAQLDEVARPGDVAAIEIYTSFAGIPAEFFDRTATCGTVVVWTKAK